MVGSITRDSVKKALMNGITADQVALLSLGLPNKADTLVNRQIISYLVTHAHPQMRKNVGSIISANMRYE